VGKTAALKVSRGLIAGCRQITRMPSYGTDRTTGSEGSNANPSGMGLAASMTHHLLVMICPVTFTDNLARTKEANYLIITLWIKWLHY
jgi:hypothetical protein